MTKRRMQADVPEIMSAELEARRKLQQQLAEVSTGLDVLTRDVDAIPPANVVNGCRISRAASQSITAGLATQVDFDTVVWDTASLTSELPDVKVLRFGIYIIQASIQWSSNSGGVRTLDLYVDGTSQLVARQETEAISTGGNLGQVASAIVAMEPSMTVAVYVTHTASVDINIVAANHFSPRLSVLGPLAFVVEST